MLSFPVIYSFLKNQCELNSQTTTKCTSYLDVVLYGRNGASDISGFLIWRSVKWQLAEVVIVRVPIVKFTVVYFCQQSRPEDLLSYFGRSTLCACVLRHWKLWVNS